jgi:hypothetical protein
MMLREQYHDEGLPLYCHGLVARQDVHIFCFSIAQVLPEQEQKGRLERLEKERNDRDVQELEIRNAANQRLGWLSSYQSVSKVRMEAQQEQLAPLLVAAKQSKAELQEAEELQVCP